MAREKQCGEAVGGGEQAVLRGEPGEGFESFLGPMVEALFAGEGVEAIENDGGDGIGAGRGRILNRFAANFEAAHRRGVFGAVEKAAGFRIAETLDRLSIVCFAGGNIAARWVVS